MEEMHRLPRGQPRASSRVSHGSESTQFLARLANRVTARFERMTGLAIATIPIELPGYPATTCPIHPACVDIADPTYCQRLWAEHIERLQTQPETHWHRCEFGMLCAVVPVVWNHHCLAACQLACPDEREVEFFEHQVELLDVLVENFVSAESEFLASHFDVIDAAELQESGTKRVPVLHPLVLAAIRYIERHLTDATMTVSSIARHLDVNATYLAHLFSTQVGIRMSRYIAAHRVELAKKLLTTTNWQIKRVAFESGHSNPYWFSGVFRAYTGQTPSKYRRTSNAG